MYQHIPPINAVLFPTEIVEFGPCQVRPPAVCGSAQKHPRPIGVWGECAVQRVEALVPSVCP
jgi:hypothetical protein